MREAAMGEHYGLIQDGFKAPLWRCLYSDLDEAKAKAQSLANEERLTFLVYSFGPYMEVARFEPAERK